jgi:prophage antirepressor-like protein
MPLPLYYSSTGTPMCVHMDLVRFVYPDNPTKDRSKVEAAVKRLGKEVQHTTLRSREVQEFRAEHHIDYRLGSKVVVYCGAESISRLLIDLGFPAPKEFGPGLPRPTHLFEGSRSIPNVPTQPSNPGSQLVMLDFDGRSLTVLENVQGRKFVLARELEAVLGYAPGSLVTQVTNEWAAELKERDHFGYMTHSELTAAVQRQNQVKPDFGQRNMILYEHGVYQVFNKTDKKLGVRHRDWVSRELLPAIRQHGYYELPEARQIVQERPQAPIAQPLQVLHDTMKDWNGWTMQARYYKHFGAGNIDMHLRQELTNEAPLRAFKLDGKTPKTEPTGRARFDALNIAKQARQLGVGQHCDGPYIERVAADIGVHKYPWLTLEARGHKTGEVWDQDGLEVILHHLQASVLQQSTQLAPWQSTGAGQEFSLDQALDLSKEF